MERRRQIRWVLMFAQLNFLLPAVLLVAGLWNWISVAVLAVWAHRLSGSAFQAAPKSLMHECEERRLSFVSEFSPLLTGMSQLHRLFQRPCWRNWINKLWEIIFDFAESWNEKLTSLVPIDNSNTDRTLNVWRNLTSYCSKSLDLRHALRFMIRKFHHLTVTYFQNWSQNLTNRFQLDLSISFISEFPVNKHIKEY